MLSIEAEIQDMELFIWVENDSETDVEVKVTGTGPSRIVAPAKFVAVRTLLGSPGHQVVQTLRLTGADAPALWDENLSVSLSFTASNAENIDFLVRMKDIPRGRKKIV